MENAIPYVIQAVIAGIFAGIVSGIAFWATVKTEIKYLRRDVDMAHKFIRQHEEKYHGTQAQRIEKVSYQG